jgi:hypothetical protein
LSDEVQQEKKWKLKHQLGRDQVIHHQVIYHQVIYHQVVYHQVIHHVSIHSFIPQATLVVTTPIHSFRSCKVNQEGNPGNQRGTRRSPAVQVIAEATSGGDRLAFAPVALLAAVLFTI